MSSEANVDAHLLSATAASELIRNGKLTIEQYAHALLRRIDQRDEDVQAWQFLDRDQVIQNAIALDAVPMSQRGPLHGIPIGVKDVIYTKGKLFTIDYMPTEYNSNLYKGHFPETDAASIAILREAGALLLGKTRTTEFAALNDGPGTLNPHDKSRTPGGSSSGSAAAVGDFQVPIALGTQTGGSVIRPASYCGIYGFKPTWNAVSREGIKFFSLTYDTFGFFSRTVDDLSLMADIMGIKDDEPPKDVSLSGARFAVIKSMAWPSAEQSIRDALEGGANALKSEGATVEEVELPAEFDMLPEWYDIILETEAGRVFLSEYRVSKDTLDAKLIGFVNNQAKRTQRQYIQALDGITALRSKFEKLVEEYDAVLTPSSIGEAPVGTHTGSYLFNKIWTALHVPVVNMTGFRAASGMPVGLSLLSGRFSDRHLLTVAAVVAPVFEKHGGWIRPIHDSVANRA